ncbi:MAG TPA: AI-2E family transporter [Flavobacteriaceae bacterium]|nr:AI-2E family transporter [Flavobacteriaceae bacterium]
MNPKVISLGILRAIGTIVGVLILLYFLYEIRSILLYIAIAAVVALIGRPMVYFFKKRLQIPNQLSVSLTLFLIFSVLTGILALFIPVIYQQSENFARLDLVEVKTNLNALNVQLRDYLGLEQIDLFDSFKISTLIEDYDFKSIPLFMSSIFGGLGSIIIGTFAVLFISFFFLTDSNLLLNSFLAFSRKKNEERLKRIFHKIKNLLSRYFVGIFLQILVLFILYTILLYIFKIQNPVAVAFICAFLNIVPYLGPVVAGILMMFFVGSNHLGSDFSTVILPNMLYVLAGYLIAQTIDNLINQPLIFGKSVKSHPLEIFIIILISGLLFGVFGMIIAVPSYTAIKVIAKESLSKYKVVKTLTRGL